MKKHKISAAGLTLVEMASVILIGGLAMMAAATMMKNYLLVSRLSLTQSRMQDIDNAITQYLNINGVLPCPALLNDIPSAATFGKSINETTPPASPPDCASKSDGIGTFTPKGNTPPAPTSNPVNLTIVIGAVPTSDLGLSAEEMADAWGDRFVYAVTDYLTASGSYNPTQGTIAIEDGAGNPLVGTGFTPASWAQYVIVSYGADRAGAYSQTGVLGGVACPAAPALENANCNFTVTPMKFRKTTQISTMAGNGYFDDYVIYHSPLSQTNSTMPSEMPVGIIAPFAPPSGSTSVLVCPTGWQNYGTTTSCTIPTGGVCCQKQ